MEESHYKRPCRKVGGAGFIGNCGILKLRYENGDFAVEKIINPNSRQTH